MLRWWQANGSTAREAFPCTAAPIHYRARGWTGRKCRFSSLGCDPTDIRTQPSSICGASFIALATYSQWRNQPKIQGANLLTFSKQQFFFRDPASQSTK